jgi:beta-lactamase superfamily II metal-dependent hydrolase
MKRIIKFLAFLFVPFILLAQPNSLPKWEKGFLDLHFISTGKGNANFCILPDGTTLLVDVGDLPSDDSIRRAPAIPNKSKTPAQWVADYIYQFHPDGKNAKLDYALITHYHDDHFGHFGNSVKTDPKGGYKLSGITELGSIIPIKILVDRGNDWPVDLKSTEVKENKQLSFLVKELSEYWKFIDYQTKVNGLVNQKFEVGSSDQFVLKNNAAGFSEFKIKNLFANGEVANSWDDKIGIHKFKKDEYPGENDLSCGIRMTYGKFDFYTGGDITGVDEIGVSDFNGIDALVAPVIGPVDVAVMNHHGNRDSQSEYYVRTIHPRVWIGFGWSSNHPGEEALRRMASPSVYPGERDFFTNYFSQANKTVMGSRFGNRYKSTSGHIVVRVYPKGEKYDVFILNDKDEQREVIAKYSYESR